MSIQKYVEIDTVYTRSINLERDINSSTIVKSYIPTSRSLRILRRIGETLNEEDMPRSWALVGPYGSGKSSFAVFLARLMGAPNNQSTLDAFNVYCDADLDACSGIYQYTEGTKGYLSVLLTGTPEPLGHRFVASLRDAALRYWQTIPGRRPVIINALSEAASQKDITIHEILVLVEELRAAVEAKKGKGLLIIFDELGKFLEYEARHYGANDIYMLQALAEMAAVGRKANVHIFTLMHQGFEQYARGLGEDLRNEWSKVQGRFENIPFLESTEQTLRIVSKAFVHKLAKDDQKVIAAKCKKMAITLAKEKALPGSLDQEIATYLFSQCYPLHPITVLILPILCQKMAQNERTLFSYLGSKEQHGLRDSLTRMQKIGEWVMPWEIFDYFILNQPAVLTDPTTHRRWAEVITAIERLGDAPLKEIELLKTIGLLNIIGAQGGFKPSKTIVSLCMTSKKATTMVTDALIEKSVLQFRKFSNEYRVWQGSDFDLDAAIKNELDQIGRFDLPSAINARKPLQPIVARRHTIKTGSLRYFTPVFVDLSSYRQAPQQTDQQRIIFCLVESADDLKTTRREVTSHFAKWDLIALCPNGSQLREAVAEVLALQRVEQNCPELQTDPVAQREFKDRMAAAQFLEDELLHDLFEHPENAQWFWKNDEITITNKRSLQQTLSTILNKIYDKAPQIHNELINREKPSAQASAARNKLVMAMVHNADKRDLDIEKFPAEKGIYRAFLRATGLHQPVNKGKWQLMPPTEDNKYNFFPVWEKIDEFLESTKDTPRSFAELNTILQAPPYGVKAGVLSLFYLTALLCYQEELALYEDKVYTPYFSDQHIERFMKRPDYFTVQRIRMYGIRASLFQQYVKVLYGENADQKSSLLAVAKPLAQFMAQLPEYTKQTNRLSDASRKARKSFDLAKSPIDLLFVRLPKACGYPAIDPDEADGRKIEGFAAALVEVIRELRDAYDKMIADFQVIMSQALFPDIQKTIDIRTLRRKACGRYEDLRQYTVDMKGLRPFIGHLADKNGNDELWLKRLLLFLGGRASDKWHDVDRDRAVKRLEELSRRLRDLHYLQASYLKTKSRLEDDFDIIRLRSMRHGKTENDEIICIDKSTKKYIQANKAEFQKLLKGFDSDETRLALLADLLDDLLEKQKNTKKDLPDSNNGVVNE